MEAYFEMSATLLALMLAVSAGDWDCGSAAWRCVRCALDPGDCEPHQLGQPERTDPGGRRTG